MNSFDFSQYDDEDYSEPPKLDKQNLERLDKILPHSNNKKESFDFDQYDPQGQEEIPKEEEEGWLKTIGRYAYQAPAGIASIYTFPADLALAGALQEAQDPEEIMRIENAYRLRGLDPNLFNEEKYLEQLQEHAKYFPTQGNIERQIAEATGLPLEAKTRGQKFLRFAGGAGKLSGKGTTLRPLNYTLPRPIKGLGVATAKEGLVEAGVPEPIADIGAFAVLKNLPKGAPGYTFGKKTKPSGMIERRYEQGNGRQPVSPSQFEKIKGKVEDDFRSVLDQLVVESPIGETTQELATNPKYKQQITAKFEEVRDLAQNMPGKFSSKEIKTAIADKIGKHRKSVITPSEFDKVYNKYMSEFFHDTATKDLFAENLVDQYRSNNKVLSELYEPGQSKTYNRAKKQAYLDYQHILADMIEKKYPKSEFSNLFKESNSQWSKIMDAEHIQEFTDALFDGKINYKKGEKVFDKNLRASFQRALGKEQFGKFETLMEDLMSTKEGMSRLKVAQEQGFDKLAKTGIMYLFHPKTAVAKFGIDSVKNVYRNLLDKPQFGFTWKEGVDAFKKGDFKKAEAKFTILDKEVKQAAQEGETIVGKAERVSEPRWMTDAREGIKHREKQKPLELTYKEPEGKGPELTTAVEKEPNIRDIKAVEQKSKESPKPKKSDTEALVEANKERTKDLVIPKEKPHLEKLNKNIEKQNNKIESEIKELENDISEANSMLPAATNKKNLEKYIEQKKELIEIKKDSLLEPIGTQEAVTVKKAPIEEIEWKFTKEDFPTKKEAQDYLDHLNRSLKKAPESHKPTLKRDIQNLEELLDVYDEVPKHLQSYSYEAPKPKKKTKNLVKHEKDTSEKIKKSQKTMERREKENKTMKTIIFPKYSDQIKKPISKNIDKISEVQSKIEKIERQNISTKGLKSQKDFLMDALKNARDKPSKAEKINIKVPGDGEFNFVNRQDVLEKMLKKVDKDWPKQAVKTKAYPKHAPVSRDPSVMEELRVKEKP